VLSGLPPVTDPRVLVGTGTFDDAGVVQLGDELALAQSVDFFTPVVDDPYDFGRIAATNALSDLYAMGATPLSALAVCAFPVHLGLEVLQQILAGGMATLRDAEVLPLGGHTVKGPELNYGLAVTGTIHPRRILANAGAKRGDALILTKPIGTGVMATALKNEELPAEHERAMIASMVRLNRVAGAAACAVETHALTDITGFGLLGHALELAAASGVRLRLDAPAVPLLPGAHAAAEKGGDFGGLIANRDWVAPRSNLAALEAVTAKLLIDPQTSGGLFAAVAPAAADDFVARCARGGVLATVVGEVIDGEPGTAEVHGRLNARRADSGSVG
jgi:selenide,water dikinase